MELVLDTNIYRNLARNQSDEQFHQLSETIKSKAKEQNIKIFFPINSAMELVSLYNDNNENERTECRKGLELLVDLSTTYSSTHIHVDFVPPLNAILEHYFHGQENTQAKIYSNVITLAQMLIGNVEPEPEEVMNGHVETVKNEIELEKQEIRDNYEDYLKSINNGEADWEFFKDKKQLRRDYFERLKIGRLSFLVGQSFVDRAYNIVGHQIVKDEEYYNIVTKFMQEFCPALVMNERLLENVGHSVEAIKDVADGRWNTVIDISLIFGALFNRNNIDRRLVTEERNIHEAYNNCGFQAKVMTLNNLKELLQI
jgi:hypothetical protein